MAAMRIKGVKRYQHPKSGRWYAYHRATGTRIKADYGTAAFLLELAALETTQVKITPQPGTIGLAIEQYCRSAQWNSLRPKTRLSYERAFEVLSPILAMPLVKCDRAFLIRLRDEILLPKRGVWLANYVLTVLSVVFAFAHDRGWVRANPLAEKVRKLKAPQRIGAANRPWSEAECAIVMARAPAHLRIPLALAMCAGLRKSDFLTVALSAIKGGTITVRTSKRNVAIAVPVHPVLQKALEGRPQSKALQIAVTSHGAPWTEGGFNASWAKLKQALEREGLIAPGLTPHGLRHTLGTPTIADILGQRSTAMARHYSENAALPESAQNLVASLRHTEASKG